MQTILPSVSIITPSYNQGKYIEETIQSVLSQNYPTLEYIIIDGGSTDGSVDIIKKYSAHLTYWVSEKDFGQAQAINKGLKHCSSEIFNWINSDDHLEPGALHKIAEAFTDPKIDLVAGRVRNFSASDSEVINNAKLSAPGLMRWDKGVQFVQPGVWMRRESFIRSGGLKERFHYSFDWDMMIRYLSLFPNVKYLTDVLVNFRLHDESKTVSSHDKFMQEESLIIEALLTDPSFCHLHPVCKKKIARAEWTRFLQDESNRRESSRAQRLMNIITHLHNQPADLKITRMTLGAIKQILRN